MRIVILTGSVRRGGNTDLLVRSFVKGAEQTNAVEIVSVADYQVKPCLGCNICETRPAGDCFQNDDMSQIYAKLQLADLLVIASPVYFYGVSAQLKAIIDRLHAPIKNDFRIKQLALLLVAAEPVPEVFESILVQYDAVLRYFRLTDAGRIWVGGVEAKGAISGHPALLAAQQLGARLCQGKL